MAEERDPFAGFKILGGSEKFEAALEELELAEEERWIEEAEEIPVSAEEVVQKIRLALGERSGGEACGRGDGSGGCSGCTCGKR